MPQTSSPDIRPERCGDALWLWIDREARRNSITPDVLEGIAAAVRQAHQDPSLRAIVLTGSGDKAFCAGADLSRGTDTFQAAADEPSTDFGRVARVVRTAPIPLIARVNGACVAGGMGLLGLCDLAIAADHARFGLPEVKVGVFPMQVLVFLRHLIGARHINELCLTGGRARCRRRCPDPTVAGGLAHGAQTRKAGDVCHGNDGVFRGAGFRRSADRAGVAVQRGDRGHRRLQREKATAVGRGCPP